MYVAMTGLRASIVCLLALLLHHRASDASPAVFKVRTSSCAGSAPRVGTAFVVQDFSGTSSANVLVTALHVIQGCSDIRIYDPACHERHRNDDRDWRMTVMPTTELHVWPAWDLAVIPLPAGDPLKLGREYVADKIDTSGSELDKLKAIDTSGNEIVHYHLSATLDKQTCMRGFVMHVGVRPSTAQYEELAASLSTDRTIVKPSKLQGSLSAESWLLNYHGDVTSGTSGAPITRNGSHTVIAFHEGGFNSRSSGWAIVLPGPKLGAPTKYGFGMGAWPHVEPTYLHQSMTDELAAQETAFLEQANRVPTQNFLAVLGTADLHGDNEFGWNAFVDYSRHPLVTFTPLGYFKLGFAIDLGYGRSQRTRRFLSPANEELERQSQTTSQAFFAAGVDLRLERLGSWFSPSLTLGGLVGRWFAPEEPPNVAKPARNSWGLWGSVKDRLMLGCKASLGCFHLVVGARATLQRTPVFDYVYTGVGAEVERQDKARMVPHYGLDFGIEWFGGGTWLGGGE
jgi:hypothetical protein